MPGVFLANVVEVQLGPLSFNRPDLPAGTRFTALMVDPVAMKAIVVSPATAITHTGVFRMFFADTARTLRTMARIEGPSNAQRTQVASWCTANGYEMPPVGLTWRPFIQFLAEQTNPAADLDGAS